LETVVLLNIMEPVLFFPDSLIS